MSVRIDVDVAVIGAGIVGCLAARTISACAPEFSVVVLDRDAVGSGASRRSAGLHLPRGATARVRRMARSSQYYYERLAEAVPALPIHPVRMSVLASTASAPRLRETYLDSARLTPAADVPGGDVQVPDGMACWSGGGSQYADVGALTEALARELRRHVDIREGVAVAAVDAADDHVVLRLSTGEALTARRVVLAPGPWHAGPAWRDLVAPLGARVKRVVALHIERPPTADDPVVVFDDEDAFLLPLADRGHWLYSYTCTDWDVDPDAPAYGLSPADVERARECLSRYAPKLLDQCTSGRVFCDAYSRTGEPQVQALGDAGRVVFAGAANGSGYRLAPAIASQAADLLHLPRSQP
ncbi:MAG: hypothetical protein QOE51_4223 [Actinoplanes sp.]|jgi:glycine/D-amino acid oxidase-like deaminating enzyme|nr:hypothetical protein [Actinoplanes sp.]